MALCEVILAYARPYFIVDDTAGIDPKRLTKMTHRDVVMKKPAMEVRVERGDITAESLNGAIHAVSAYLIGVSK